MRHLLMDPTFPDIVGQWAEEEAREEAEAEGIANDKDGELHDLNDPLLALVARAEIEASASGSAQSKETPRNQSLRRPYSGEGAHL